MNIVLTGATGFLGSHLLKVLVDDGHFVTIIKRSTSNCDRIRSILPACEFLDADKQPLSLAFFKDSVDAVIHTACCYGKGDEPESMLEETNVLFPLRLLELSIAHRVPSFINTDSFFNNASLLPSYMLPYSLSKRHFVEWAKYLSKNIRFVNLKLQHMYGPGDGTAKFTTWLLKQHIANVASIPLSKGEQKRDFVYIDDVVSAYMKVLETLDQLNQYSELEVGSGQKMKLKEFVLEFHKQYCRIDPKCTSELEFGALPYKEKELMDVSVDISGLQSLGWQPTVSTQEGLKRLILSYS